MDIPHTVTARPDTGLYNAKLGIWLFLASEVMLFGGLFSAYVFLRLGAEPGYWPRGLLNVPVGTFNTAVLILSSVTVVMAWAALKMRQFARYKFYMLITIICGSLFLVIKVAYEYPEKFHHFGAFIRKDALQKYEPYLGNEYLASKGREPRVEITGHLLDAPAAAPESLRKAAAKNAEHFRHQLHEKSGGHGGGHETVVTTDDPDDFVVQLDPANANPTDPSNEKPHFWPKKQTMQTAVIKSVDVSHSSMFVPKHSSYFSVYFMITGLHGLHVLGGVIVFIYFLGPGAKLYQQNPEHLANRVECAGLFWHFVDLVWIFAFPIFYLL
jgi:cytochrome c oxidase subunit 3